MNIVFVTTELASSNNSAGGLASFTANIAKVFASHGHHVSIVLVTTKEQNIEFEQDIMIFPLHVPMTKWKIMDKLSRLLCKLCKRDNDDMRRAMMNLYKGKQVKEAIQLINQKDGIDIIHYCNISFLNRLSPKGLPYVVRISGFVNIWKGGANTANGSVQYKDNPLSLVGKQEENTIKRSRYVVSPSYLLAGIIKENMQRNATVIESPFVLKVQEWDDTIINQYALKEKRYIIHYGSLRYAKGTYVVAQLVKDLLNQYSDIYMVLSGKNEDLIDENGNKIKADEFVKKSAGEFANRVIYVGRLVREQLYPLIQNAELCLLPSRIENLSNACIEAMAMGKIVVATNGASYEQLIDDRISGFLCERDNPASYLKAINEALDMNSEEKETMGTKALEVTKRLEPQKIYQEYMDFYEKVIREW